MARYIECETACAEIDKGDLLVGNNAEFAKEIIRRTPTADVAPRSEVAREVLAKVDDLAWRHKMRGHVSMDKFHDDIEELKQKYKENEK